MSFTILSVRFTGATGFLPGSRPKCSEIIVPVRVQLNLPPVFYVHEANGPAPGILGIPHSPKLSLILSIL